ncbi:hypothetical protein BDR06DRAFT_1013559 [Suillus hirtellus]|nr:hypothetical protein BDR06DRAFT_1013559 [Suillus hirtellus]
MAVQPMRRMVVPILKNQGPIHLRRSQVHCSPKRRTRDTPLPKRPEIYTLHPCLPTRPYAPPPPVERTYSQMEVRRYPGERQQQLGCSHDPPHSDSQPRPSREHRGTTSNDRNLGVVEPRAVEVRPTLLQRQSVSDARPVAVETRSGLETQVRGVGMETQRPRAFESQRPPAFESQWRQTQTPGRQAVFEPQPRQTNLETQTRPPVFETQARPVAFESQQRPMFEPQR